jgi:hypothetical protein
MRFENLVRGAVLGSLALLTVSTSPTFAGTRPGQGKPGVPVPGLQGGQPLEVNIPAHKAALASALSARVESKTFEVGAWKLKVKSFEITQIDNQRVAVKVSAQLKKNNPYPLPDASSSGAVRLLFSVGVEGQSICTPTVQVTGVNFNNVQNDLEQGVRRVFNEVFGLKVCVPV